MKILSTIKNYLLDLWDLMYEHKYIYCGAISALVLVVGVGLFISLYGNTYLSPKPHMNHMQFLVSNLSDQQINVKVVGNGPWKGGCDKTIIPNQLNVDVCKDLVQVDGDGIGMPLREGPKLHQGSISMFPVGANNDISTFGYKLNKVGHAQYNWKPLSENNNPLKIRVEQNVVTGDCLMSRDSCSMTIKFIVPANQTTADQESGPQLPIGQ